MIINKSLSCYYKDISIFPILIYLKKMLQEFLEILFCSKSKTNKQAKSKFSLTQLRQSNHSYPETKPPELTPSINSYS